MKKSWWIINSCTTIIKRYLNLFYWGIFFFTFLRLLGIVLEKHWGSEYVVAQKSVQWEVVKFLTHHHTIHPQTAFTTNAIFTLICSAHLYMDQNMQKTSTVMNEAQPGPTCLLSTGAAIMKVGNLCTCDLRGTVQYFLSLQKYIQRKPHWSRFWSNWIRSKFSSSQGKLSHWVVILVSPIFMLGQCRLVESSEEPFYTK